MSDTDTVTHYHKDKNGKVWRMSKTSHEFVNVKDPKDRHPEIEIPDDEKAALGYKTFLIIEHKGTEPLTLYKNSHKDTWRKSGKGKKGKKGEETTDVFVKIVDKGVPVSDKSSQERREELPNTAEWTEIQGHDADDENVLPPLHWIEKFTKLEVYSDARPAGPAPAAAPAPAPAAAPAPAPAPAPASVPKKTVDFSDPTPLGKEFTSTGMYTNKHKETVKGERTFKMKQYTNGKRYWEETTADLHIVDFSNGIPKRPQTLQVWEIIQDQRGTFLWIDFFSNKFTYKRPVNGVEVDAAAAAAAADAVKIANSELLPFNNYYSDYEVVTDAEGGIPEYNGTPVHYKHDKDRNHSEEIARAVLRGNYLKIIPKLIQMTPITQPYVFPYEGLVPEDKGITGIVIIQSGHAATVSTAPTEIKKLVRVGVMHYPELDGSNLRPELDGSYLRKYLVRRFIIANKEYDVKVLYDGGIVGYRARNTNAVNRLANLVTQKLTSETRYKKDQAIIKKFKDADFNFVFFDEAGVINRMIKLYLPGVVSHLRDADFYVMTVTGLLMEHLYPVKYGHSILEELKRVIEPNERTNLEELATSNEREEFEAIEHQINIDNNNNRIKKVR